MRKKLQSLHLAFCLMGVLSLSSLNGCKNTASIPPAQSQIASRYASEEPLDSRKIYLQLSKTEYCQVGSKNNRYLQNYLNEQKDNLQITPEQRQHSPGQALIQTKKTLEICPVDLEDWLLKSIALGKPAPFDVAGLTIDDMISFCKVAAIVSATSDARVASGFAIASVGLEWWQKRKCEK